MPVKPSSKNPTQPDADASARGRGRPRNERAHRAVLKAARELLESGGISAVTMEGVAARAGVSKPTLYRWWPDRHALTMAALMPAPPPARAQPASNQAVEKPLAKQVKKNKPSPLRLLREQLAAMANLFQSRTGRYVASILATSDADTELSKAFRNHFLMERRNEGRALLAQAVQNGTLRDNLDMDVSLDLIYGPLFFRLLLGHAPLDPAFVQQSFDQALQGLVKPSD
jgi:AcrR family transcriptional regulator